MTREDYINTLELDNAELKQENKQLKMIVNEYERLNKCFKITNVQEYNIDELLSYKDNWNKLKEYCEEVTFYYTTGNGEFKTEMVGNARNGIDILNKMQELEQGNDSNE